MEEQRQERKLGPPSIIKKISDIEWELPPTFKAGMHVPARIFASKKLLDNMDEGVFNQISNVASLPGIVKHAMCMPDGHWGYGFPIGGVAAFDMETGIISPGGIGFDINCGMRLVTTNLTYNDVKPKLKALVDLLFKRVPAGVGCKGFVDVSKGQFDDVMIDGTQWCAKNGYAWKEDIERTENNGKIPQADPAKISDRARKRGMDQIGTLGSGNHYLEIQVAKKENIFLPEVAAKMGIDKPDQVVVMVHCGSRGFGHQIGTDYLKIFNEIMPKYGINVLDKELACAPFQSPEGQDYFKAMACAANMAFANRQVILHRIRECFSQIFGQSPEALDMHLIYDVAHNIAKVEEHTVDGKKKNLLVHRKGSTRCFPPGHPELPPIYKKIGQPVILGGSMETGSYLLVGAKGAMEKTFGSTAHGSGRTMSRTKAVNMFRGDQLQKDMEKKGIYVHAVSMRGLAEEAGDAYKDVDEVVETMEKAGVSNRVVALKPIGNVKG